MEWAQTHYNLIVSSNTETPMFRSSSGLDSFRGDRLFEGTDENLAAKYRDDLASLSEMLALVVAERYPGGESQPAFVSRLSEIERLGRDIHFRFEHLIGRFTSEEMF